MLNGVIDFGLLHEQPNEDNTLPERSQQEVQDIINSRDIEFRNKIEDDEGHNSEKTTNIHFSQLIIPGEGTKGIYENGITKPCPNGINIEQALEELKHRLINIKLRQT